MTSLTSSYSPVAVFTPVTPCRLLATSNVSGTYVLGSRGNGSTLTGVNLTTVDSVAPVAGDRICLQGQTASLQNGIYVVSTSGNPGVLTRAEDFHSAEQIQPGQVITIYDGTANVGAQCVVEYPGPAVVDVSSVLISANLTTGGLGQAASKSVSDNSKASVASVSGATVVGHLAKFADTTGTVIDSGLISGNIKAALSATWGGGSASHAFSVTGVTTSSIINATIQASANAVSVVKAVPTADTITVTFSADPGAGTIVQFVYGVVAQ